MAIVGAYVGFSKALVVIFPVFLLAWLRFAIAAGGDDAVAAPAGDERRSTRARIACSSSSRSSATSCSRSACSRASTAARRSRRA
jgi:hypothetical protein